jgi:hypothetical protein
LVSYLLLRTANASAISFPLWTDYFPSKLDEGEYDEQKKAMKIQANVTDVTVNSKKLLVLKLYIRMKGQENSPSKNGSRSIRPMGYTMKSGFAQKPYLSCDYALISVSHYWSYTLYKDGT